MEIKQKGTILPANAMESIQAGRAVVIDNFAAHTRPDNTIGARYPHASEIRVFVAGFPATNQMPPYYETLPSYTYALRQGFDRGVNMPVTGLTLRMVAPNFVEPEETIPSGAQMLMYDMGIFAVTSGCYNGTTFVPGDTIDVEANTGKWQHTGGTQVATVVDFDPLGKLVFKLGVM